MRFGFNLLAWRRHRGVSQETLAVKAGILRPYLSRLERNQSDPSLSMVHRLAAALDLSAGQLLDTQPPNKRLNRHSMDKLARATLKRDKRSGLGDHALRRLRVWLGEDQWKALLKRMEKHAAFLETSQQ